MHAVVHTLTDVIAKMQKREKKSKIYAEEEGSKTKNVLSHTKNVRIKRKIQYSRRELPEDVMYSGSAHK